MDLLRNFSSSEACYSDFFFVLPFFMFLVIMRHFIIPIGTKIGKYISPKLHRKRHVSTGLRCYKCSYHTFSILLALLFFRNCSWWFNDYPILFENPKEIHTLEKIWILFQISYEIQSSVFIFLEDQRSDIAIMLIHHACTVLLSIIGYFQNPHFSILCTYVHNVSDIHLSLLKLFNNLKLIYLLACQTVINLTTWIYYRLYLFPIQIYYTIFVGWGKSGFAIFVTPFLLLLFGLHIYWCYLILQSYYLFICDSNANYDVTENNYDESKKVIRIKKKN